MIWQQIVCWLGAWSSLGAALAVYATRGGRIGPFALALGVDSDK